MGSSHSIVNSVAGRSVIGKKYKTIKSASLFYHGKGFIGDQSNEIITINPPEGETQMTCSYITFLITDVTLSSGLDSGKSIDLKGEIVEVGNIMSHRKIINSKWKPVNLTVDFSLYMGLKVGISVRDFFDTSYPPNLDIPIKINSEKLIEL